MKAFPSTSETVETSTRQQIVDLTQVVRQAVRKAGVQDGYVVVFSPHTTAAVTINENYDPDVKHDVLTKLEQLFPQVEAYYQHDEGNSDAHLKTAVIGNSAMILIERGDLLLGRWQGVYFCEFDGPRERRVVMKIFGA
jgi:secondary thiamine-phosphate synthase enzyme